MQISEPQNPATIDSSVCDACRGLFDMGSPRGFVIDRYGEDKHGALYPRYIYTYIHHKKESDLVSSGNAGCHLCKIIVGGFNLKRTRLNIRAPPLPSQYESPTQPATGAKAVHSRLSDLGNLHDTSNPDKDIPEKVKSEEESNMDDWEPSKLANFVKEKPGLRKEEDIVFHCNGRVVIQHGFENKEGLGSDSGITLSRVDCPSLYDALLGLNWNCAYLFHFTTPFDLIDPHREHRPSNDLLSESHISLIDRWRNICDREHESCQKISYDQPLPTRILEIIGSTEDNEPVRLVETHGKKRGMYACLSYCWGDSEAAKVGQTTRHNLSRLLQSIPLHDLPSTVVDAIKLCYKLRCRYLWVDRLCIIQDDREDWLLEASRMCGVYSRSALTISVPICKESSQSFISERAKGFREQSRFATVTYAGETSEKHQRWFFNDRITREQGPWFLEHDWDGLSLDLELYQKNRWIGRCWTFQEWMLSPRVLHIDSMTLWDCFEGYANELNWRHMTSANILRDPSRLGKDIPWELIVYEYSRREITREEDRLPALAGLAERYARTTGKTYLAGLWLEDLPQSLLWEKKSRKLAPQTWYDSRSTPSWTWSSLNQSVWYTRAYGRHHNPGSTAMASIRSTSCQYQPPSSFAGLKKAWIDMSCYTSAVTKRDHETVGQDMDERKVYAGGGEWLTAAEYDYDHGDSDGNDISNVFLLLIGRERFNYEALIAKRFKWEDGCFCFRRLGIARFQTAWTKTSEYPWYLDVNSEWEEQVIRLV